MPESTRARLVEIGMEHILDQGYAFTGIREILEAAQIPKGSFYYYFESKDAFIEAIVERYSELNANRRRQLLLGDPSTSPLARLRGYFDAYTSMHAGNVFRHGCLLGNLSAEVASQSNAVREKIKRGFVAWQAMIETVLADAQHRGEIASTLEVRAVAAFVVNGWEGALLRMKAERSAAPLQQFVELLFSAVLGVAAKPAKKSAATSTKTAVFTSTDKSNSKKATSARRAPART